MTLSHARFGQAPVRRASPENLVRTDSALADVVLDLRMAGRDHAVPVQPPVRHNQRLVDGMRLCGWTAVQSPGIWVSVVRWEDERSGSSGAFVSSATSPNQTGLMPRHVEHLARSTAKQSAVVARAQEGMERVFVANLALVIRLMRSRAVHAPVLYAETGWLQWAAYRAAWACAGVEDLATLPETLDVLARDSWVQHRGQVRGTLTLCGAKVVARAQGAGFADLGDIATWARGWFPSFMSAMSAPSADDGRRDAWERALFWHSLGWEPGQAARWHEHRYPAASGGSATSRWLTTKTITTAEAAGMSPALVHVMAGRLPGGPTVRRIESAVARWAGLGLPPLKVGWYVAAGISPREAAVMERSGEVPDVATLQMLVALRGAETVGASQRLVEHLSA